MKATIDGKPWLDVVQTIVDEAGRVDRLYERFGLQALKLPGMESGNVLSEQDAYDLQLGFLYTYLRESRLLRSRAGART